MQAYFEALSPEQREQLGALRSHIRHLWPEAEEDFSFRLPTYRFGGKPAFALAGQKTGLVLHVIAYDLLEPFKHDMMRLDCGRSCFRFRQLTPELQDLFDRVIKYVGSQMHLSRRSARPTTHRKALRQR